MWFIRDFGFQCFYAPFFMISISGCGLLAVFVSVFLRSILYDSISGCGLLVVFVSVFLHGILCDFHLSLWFLFQCSYAIFFMISISGAQKTDIFRTKKGQWTLFENLKGQKWKKPCKIHGFGFQCFYAPSQVPKKPIFLGLRRDNEPFLRT